MERTKKNKNELIRWKKLGRGSFRMGNKIIKPGQIFSARLMDIPKGCEDIIAPIDKLPAEMKEDIKVVQAVYSVKHRSGKWFDVVNANGKVLNEKAMTRESALELIKLL